MRILGDIIEDLKDGKKVDYEEARLAAIVYSDLLFFAEQNIKQLLGDNKLVKYIIEKDYKDRHYKALNKSPEEWLGTHHPDNPEEQKHRKMSKEIFDKFMKERREV